MTKVFVAVFPTSILENDPEFPTILLTSKSDINTFEKVAFVTNILENDAESPIMLSTSNSDMNPKPTDISSMSTYEKVALEEST